MNWWQGLIVFVFVATTITRCIQSLIQTIRNNKKPKYDYKNDLIPICKECNAKRRR